MNSIFNNHFPVNQAEEPHDIYTSLSRKLYIQAYFVNLILSKEMLSELAPINNIIFLTKLSLESAAIVLKLGLSSTEIVKVAL